MDRAGVVLGVLAILVGLALGYLMLAFPGNVNPAYPIWIALLAPLAFVFGGLLFGAHALGYPGVIAIAFKALAFCLLVLIHWGAFFSSGIECRETMSFFGVTVLERYSSEDECRASLRMIIVCSDAAIIVALAVLAWRKMAGPDRELPK
jgi:hypothetical protein